MGTPGRVAQALAFLVFLLGCVRPVVLLAQGSDGVSAWLAAVNQARLDEGLAPYSLSTQLTAAAQRHADDIALHGFPDPSDPHLGSDGTHEQERVLQTGYPAWTWNGGQPIVDENMWSGHGTVEDAMAWFLRSDVHRSNILSRRYREIGIGVAVDGAGQSYYVLVFSARPNVLPVYINDGAAATNDPQIAIHLTNEEARPEGEGVSFMGQAVEVMISDRPDFAGASWQAWSEYVSWTLPDAPGEYTIYVRYRDAAGRTAAAADSIVLGEAAPVPTPVPPTATPMPTDTPVSPTATQEIAPTLAPTPTFTLEPTETALSPSPPAPSPATTDGREVFPTWTPLPTRAPARASASQSPTIGFLLLLEGLALGLGLYLALRRGGRGRA